MLETAALQFISESELFAFWSCHVHSPHHFQCLQRDESESKPHQTLTAAKTRNQRQRESNTAALYGFGPKYIHYTTLTTSAVCSVHSTVCPFSVSMHYLQQFLKLYSKTDWTEKLKFKMSQNAMLSTWPCKPLLQMKQKLSMILIFLRIYLDATHSELMW